MTKVQWSSLAVRCRIGSPRDAIAPLAQEKISMRPAYARFPLACLLHAIGLAALMFAYQRSGMPLYLSIPA